MPTYTYICTKCSVKHELLLGINDDTACHCSKCGAPCERMIGSGGRVVFKGSGFYETDYKGK